MIEQTKASPAWPSMLTLAHTLAYDVRLLNEGVVPADRLSVIACPVLGTTGSLSPPWAAASAHGGLRLPVVPSTGQAIALRPAPGPRPR